MLLLVGFFSLSSAAHWGREEREAFSFPESRLEGADMVYCACSLADSRVQIWFNVHVHWHICLHYPIGSGYIKLGSMSTDKGQEGGNVLGFGTKFEGRQLAVTPL